MEKRETAVTSPHGLHVGHYKAVIYKMTILEVHQALLLILFQTGMVPSRWQINVQIMLEKEQGTPWIYRLRVIELFDAQANEGFQIFVGRHMMKHTVDNEILSEESLGSTPGKMAASALVQKLIYMDQLCIERRAGGIFDCDASGCYNRILPLLASVHMQALGLQKSIGTLLAHLMFMAKRYVCTKHRVSTKHITTTKRNILHDKTRQQGRSRYVDFTFNCHVCSTFISILGLCSDMYTTTTTSYNSWCGLCG